MRFQVSHRGSQAGAEGRGASAATRPRRPQCGHDVFDAAENLGRRKIRSHRKEWEMTQPVYEKLTDALRMRGGVAPAIKCPEFYALMEELFTPDEAEMASKMPFGLVSAADMAKETGGDPEVTGEILESMANKGLLLSFVQHDVMHYDLLQLVPGIFEMQFMTGEVSERAKRLAYLFEDYSNAMQKLPRSGASGVFPTFPWARVVTVLKTL